MSALPESEYGHRIAPYDWLVIGTGRATVLHAPAGLTDEQAHYLFDGGADDVLMVCGRRLSGAVIPGVFDRMGGPRCLRCCDRKGYPRGIGSPKNDKTIRVMEGWDDASDTTNGG